MVLQIGILIRVLALAILQHRLSRQNVMISAPSAPQLSQSQASKLCSSLQVRSTDITGNQLGAR